MIRLHFIDESNLYFKIFNIISTEPEDLREHGAVETGIGNITVNWKAGSTAGGRADRFRVTATRDGKEERNKTENFVSGNKERVYNHTLTGLTPGGAYTVRITAEAGNQTSNLATHTVNLSK